MVVTGAVLFLIGTINSFTTANPIEPTEIIIEKHINPTFAEKLTNYGLQSGVPPFISNFMQHGTNVFFKPLFILSSPFAAPAQGMIIESKEDCKKRPMIPAISFAPQPQIVIDEPVKIVETIASDGEPPVVDKVLIVNSSMPMAELPDRPLFISPLPETAVNLPVSSPVVFSDSPVLPPLSLIPIPVKNTSANAFLEPIPSAPELLPLELPQAPVDLNEPYQNPIVEAVQLAIIEEIKPMPIPDTPELLPLPVLETLVPSLPPVLPEVPIPAAPELPPLEEPQTSVILQEPVEIIPAVIQEMKPVPIPEISELPPLPLLETLVPSLPPMPLLPTAVKPEYKPETEPAPYVEVHENHIPLHIPEAPELPPYLPPPLPVPVILPGSFKECDKKPTLVETPLFEIHSEHIKIPDAPDSLEITPETVILPSSPPALIEKVENPTILEDVKPAEPMTIPSPPELPPISMPDLSISVAVSEPIAPEVPLIVKPQTVLIEEPVLQSIEIPAPPIKFPELPALPVIHDSSVIIAETSSLEQEIISNEITLGEVSESVLPVAIPQAPFLPAAAEIPLPVPIEEVSVTNEEAKPVAKPSIIPPAPELPPLTFQPAPILLEEHVMGVYPPAELTPVVTEESKLPQLEISNAPLYMTFAEPPKSSIMLTSPMAPAPLSIVFSQEMGVADKIASPTLSKIESIISFPTTCVKNIVIERILPNIAREGIEVEPSLSPNYPVFSPFSSNFGIRLF